MIGRETCEAGGAMSGMGRSAAFSAARLVPRAAVTVAAAVAAKKSRRVKEAGECMKPFKRVSSAGDKELNLLGIGRD